MDWLDELEALAKAITPGPYVMSKGSYLAEVRSTHPVQGRYYANYQIIADAEYDAALRSAAPRMIAIARAADALSDAMGLQSGPFSMAVRMKHKALRKALEAE